MNPGMDFYRSPGEMWRCETGWGHFDKGHAGEPIPILDTSNNYVRIKPMGYS